MTQRISRIIICIIAIMCIFCSSLTAFAENGDVDFDFNIQPIEPTTQEEIIETEEPTEEPTEKPTEAETEKPTKKPDNKPTQSQETRPQQRPQENNQNNQNNQNDNESEGTTEEQTTEEVLPEGAFYVYLERNNGERRLKTVMEEPGVLPKPEDPKRKGYIFDGWYKDPEFKKEWSFLKDVAKEELVIYAKWIADESTVEFDIVVEKTVGGKLEVNPRKASKGEPVFITVTPDEGKRLVPGSLLINGKATDVFSFLMPKGEVTISASFENIPESAEEDTDDKNFMPLIIVGIVVLVVIIAFVVVIVMRRRDFNADLDPDEELDDIQEEEIVWIDDSITVKDGFKEGKKIVENVEPDYGAPDADIEE